MGLVVFEKVFKIRNLPLENMSQWSHDFDALVMLHGRNEAKVVVRWY